MHTWPPASSCTARMRHLARHRKHRLHWVIRFLSHRKIQCHRLLRFSEIRITYAMENPCHFLNRTKWTMASPAKFPEVTYSTTMATNIDKILGSPWPYPLTRLQKNNDATGESHEFHCLHLCKSRELQYDSRLEEWSKWVSNWGSIFKGTRWDKSPRLHQTRGSFPILRNYFA